MSKQVKSKKRKKLHWGSFLSACSILRHKLPSKHKVVVRRRKLKEDSGYCSKQNKRFDIRVCKTLEENAQILILIHEWAHVLAWDADGSDHGPNWGKCYARCWRALVEEFNE